MYLFVEDSSLYVIDNPTERPSHEWLLEFYYEPYYDYGVEA